MLLCTSVALHWCCFAQVCVQQYAGMQNCVSSELWACRIVCVQNYRCAEFVCTEYSPVLRIISAKNCVCSELWSVQGFIQVLCFCVRFYFSNVWLDVHGFNTNLKEMRMGFIKPGPKFLRWIHVRQRQC